MRPSTGWIEEHRIQVASLLFSLRTFAAAMLALYFSYLFDLSQPVWAFMTVYIVSAPFLGMVRSKAVYRILGTLTGAVFCVAVIPNLVDAPAILILTIACWIAGCLYLSIIDGTPRSYAFMLAGYTTALIGFPAVDVPQNMFDIALSRSEEIGLGILCVQLMSYLPFQQHAGDALLERIDKWLQDARLRFWDLLAHDGEDSPVGDWSPLMIDAANLDALRIHASYDMPKFKDIEGWMVDLQRHIYEYLADLITLEAQIAALKRNDRRTWAQIHSITDAILAWVKTGETSAPESVTGPLEAPQDSPAMHGLIKCGAVDTLSNLVTRTGECAALRLKIAVGAKADSDHMPIARYVDRRQAAIYGFFVAGLLCLISSFWILASWPEGKFAAMFATIVVCFFASLEAPPKIAFIALTLFSIGASIGWCYNFRHLPAYRRISSAGLCVWANLHPAWPCHGKAEAHGAGAPSGSGNCAGQPAEQIQRRHHRFSEQFHRRWYRGHVCWRDVGTHPRYQSAQCDASVVAGERQIAG